MKEPKPNSGDVDVGFWDGFCGFDISSECVDDVQTWVNKYIHMHIDYGVSGNNMYVSSVVMYTTDKSALFTDTNYGIPKYLW